MARAIWSGAVSFGLVNVPVRLFSAVSSQNIRFNMLHGKDGGRIQLKRVCSIDGEEVPFSEIVKGYELSPDNYVVVEPEELQMLDPVASRTIDIHDFVDLGQIDPVYFERTYYTAPDKGAGKAYALLVQAMRKTGKVAVARMVMRGKGYLCCLRPLGQGLAVSTMLHADEVVPQDQVLTGVSELRATRSTPESGSKSADRELDMAVSLVESLSAEFEPERYPDLHRERVLELIERKAQGQEIVSPPEAPQPQVMNLADALAKSLEAARQRRGKAGKEPRSESRSASRSERGTIELPREQAAAKKKKAGAQKTSRRSNTSGKKDLEDSEDSES